MNHIIIVSMGEKKSGKEKGMLLEFKHSLLHMKVARGLNVGFEISQEKKGM